MSVVIAVRNGQTSLVRTLNSLAGDSDLIREILVVDDGSNDDTPEILASLAAMDPRLVILSGGGAGLTVSLAMGCRRASGDFIARQDCGDSSLPGRLAAQVAAMQSMQTPGFVSCYTRYVAPDGEEIEISNGGVAGEGSGDIQLGLDGIRSVGPSHHGSVMFRRDLYHAVGGYRPAFRFAQDWDLWLRMAERASFVMVPEVLYEATVDPLGISMMNPQRQRAYARLAKQASLLRLQGRKDDSLVAAGPPRLKRGMPRPTGNYFIGSVLLQKKDRAACKYLWRAVRESPWYLPAWCKALFASMRIPRI